MLGDMGEKLSVMCDDKGNRAVEVNNAVFISAGVRGAAVEINVGGQKAIVPCDVLRRLADFFYSEPEPGIMGQIRRMDTGVSLR